MEVSRINYPSYIHLWDGEGYAIPRAFWNGTSSSYEIHQGEHFRLVRNSTGIFLYTKTGVAYVFDPTSLNRLTKIIDTLNSTITFAYNGSQISSITDTVGRSFLLCYKSGFLTSIEQSGGSCGSETNFIRKISYSYNGSSLVSVTDPAGRQTSFLYNGVSDPNAGPWLLSRITYPTKWYSSYSYTQALLGTQASSYRVLRQIVNASSVPTSVRWFQYSYRQGPGDQVTNSFVLAYNGTLTVPASNTTYAFSFALSAWNVTDASHHVLRGDIQYFGMHGEVPRETVIVGDGSGGLGSYTNYYRYDLWGNQIYSRRAITSSWSHESFNAYYNDGLPPGFNAFQETFSQGNYTSTDNPWNVFNGTWLVKNGVYNGTWNSGSDNNVFAWADIGKGDLSITAGVYITSNKTGNPSEFQRIGVFTHYPGGGNSKWGLVLHTWPGQTYLELVNDPTNGASLSDPAYLGTSNSSARIGCPIITGVWYYFTLTVHGSQATGIVTIPSLQMYCSVSGTFPSGPATSGTAFGLYSGGYSALFDNVTVATVSSAANPSSPFFTNSFINGAPRPTVHNALAGTAELQSARALSNVETYYSYFPSGELNQGRQLYYPPGAFNQWLTTSRTYDSYGNLVKLTDPKGNQTLYGYSSKYQSAYLTSQNRTLIPGGTLISKLYSYNFTTGDRLSYIDPLGFNTTYKYDILGRLTRVNYPSSLGFAAYIYNDTANYVDVSNENGWKTRQIYDGLGRLVVVDRFSGTTSYSNQTSTYNWMNKLTGKTDPLGNRYLYQYDVLGRTISTVEPNGNSTQTVYNDLASWVRTADENGVYKCKVYDRLGRLISVVENSTVTCQSGIVTNYYYDDLGNLASVITSRLQSTSYSYDNLNRLTNTSYPDGTSELFTYDNSGNLITKVDRKGVTTQYSYDSLNRVLTVNYLGTIVASDSYTYDRNSNLVQLSSQNATIAYTYDARNRVLSETYTVITGFNMTSSPTSLKINTGSSASSTMTLTSVNGFTGSVGLSYSAPSGITLTFTPNSVSLASGVSLSSTATVSVASTVLAGTYTVTVTGSSKNPGMVTRSVSITINVPGFTLSLNPTSVGEYCNPYGCPYYITTTSNLTITSMGGFSGNVTLSYIAPSPSGGTSVTGPSSVNISAGGSATLTLTATLPTRANTDYYWTIQGKGGGYTTSTTLDVYYHACSINCTLTQTSSLTQASSTMPMSAQTPSSTVSTSFTISYTYNGELVNKTSYPDGLMVKYTYDPLGRVVAVSPLGSATNYATFTYNTDDQPTMITFGNGLVGSYTYDTLSRPLKITLTNSTSTLLSLSYSYYKTGTVSSVTGTVNSAKVNEQYTYDPLQRLTNATVTTGNAVTTEWYEYDSVGNRNRQNVNGTITSYTYNMANNELTSTSGAVYSYDKNGDLLTQNVTSTGKKWAYSWGPAGNMVGVKLNSNVQGVYAYDGLGRRVESVESTTTLYAYGGTESLYELVPGATSNSFIYAAGMRIAKVSGTATSYYHTDTLGSTRLVTDGLKNILFSDNYQPFGQDNGTPTGSQTYKFTGKPYSSATGLYYYGARWYDPSIGRFISPDPDSGQIYNPQSLNPYIYVMNSPTRLVDPDGAAPVDSLARALVTFGLVFARKMKWEYTLLGRWSGGFQTLPTSLYGSGKPPLAVAWRPDIPGVQDSKPIAKLDMPDPNGNYPVEWDYHIVQGERTHLPAGRLGEATDFVLRNGGRIRSGLLVAGLALSAWNIYSAYREDTASGGGYSHTIETVAGEAGGWGGAIAGCELGGAVGTLAEPGLGSLAGCFVGGVVGGVFGEQAARSTVGFLMQASWMNSPLGTDPEYYVGHSGFAPR